MLRFVLILIFSFSFIPSVNAQSCSQTPKVCSDKELCYWSTEREKGVGLKNAKKLWSSGSWRKHVSEAKARGLSCDVFGENDEVRRNDLEALTQALEDERKNSLEILKRLAFTREAKSSLENKNKDLEKSIRDKNAQLEELTKILDETIEKDFSNNAEVRALGEKLNAALAKVASEKKEDENIIMDLKKEVIALKNIIENQKTMQSSIILPLYWLLHALIMFFLYILWNVERSRGNSAIRLIDNTEMLDPNDVATRNLLSYEYTVGPFYRIWRFVLRPTFFILLCFLIAGGIVNEEYFIIYPVIGIFLLVLLPRQNLVRILFPILISIGYIMVPA